MCDYIILFRKYRIIPAEVLPNAERGGAPTTVIPKLHANLINKPYVYLSK